MAEKSRKKVGLVLGAGGARGFCHIGVLEVLANNGIPIDIVAGCSMGAMIGGGFAAGIAPSEMRRIAETTNQSVIMDFDLNITRPGFAKGERAMRIYKGLIGESRIEDCKIKYAAIASDLVTNTLVTYRSGPIWKAVRSSMSIPAVFIPVYEEDRVLVDGGVLCRLPLQTARDLGADILIAVDAFGEPHPNPELKSALDVIERSYMMLDWKSVKNDIKSADITITPDMGNKSMMKFKNNLLAIEAGIAAANHALPDIVDLLVREEVI